MDTASIKLDAKACQGLFANLLSRVGDLKDVPPLVTEVQDQYGRFNLWTASMAVFAPGQACLDFRLKDVPEARDLFVKHISILTTRIEQRMYCHTARAPGFHLLKPVFYMDY